MDILIPDSWLRKYLKTKATTAEIARYLSLCSQSVERVTKAPDDLIYHIEITTNRPDCFSVYGIARELAAILPRFNIEAKLLEIEEEKITLPKIKNPLPLAVEIKDRSLCPRFTALIFDNVKIKKSPEEVSSRIELSGIRSLNNCIDISNYLMLEIGQPMHAFDYDKIKGAKMILRESAGGEKLTTLDGQTRVIPEGTIIIEDGEGRIIDLCGIMGGENSAIDEETTRVVVFVQTYDPVRIRNTCQKMGFRTEAASRFEKGIDPENVMLAMKKATAMMEDLTLANVASNVTDLYPEPQKSKTVSVSLSKIEKVLGIPFDLNMGKKYLEALGFSCQITGENLAARVPHWRYNDITIPEDLIEEMARIYSYDKIQGKLPEGQIPTKKESPLFFWEDRLLDSLKYRGFTEIVSYSLVGADVLQKAGLNPDNSLKVANPLLSDLTYLRPSIIPSLLDLVAKNNLDGTSFRFFEIANVYSPKKGDLPEQKPRLAVIMSGQCFYEAKGILESIFGDFGIDNYSFSPSNSYHRAEVSLGKNSIGFIGEREPGPVTVFEVNLEALSQAAKIIRKYTPIPKYPAIVEDLAFIVPPKVPVAEMMQLIKSVDELISNVCLLDSYNNTRTFRITYQDPNKNLSGEETEKIRMEIIEKVKTTYKSELKTLS